MATRGSKSSTSEPKGVHLAQAKPAKVEDYPERPYADAVTDEHREFLAAQGVVITRGTESEQAAVTP